MANGLQWGSEIDRNAFLAKVFGAFDTEANVAVDERYWGKQHRRCSINCRNQHSLPLCTRIK